MGYEPLDWVVASLETRDLEASSIQGVEERLHCKKLSRYTSFPLIMVLDICSYGSHSQLVISFM